MSWKSDTGFHTLTDEFKENELNKALNQYSGLVRESLLMNKLAVDNVMLFKQIITEEKKEEILLVYFVCEEYSYRYVLKNLGGNKNEKENDVKSNYDNLYDAFN